MTKLLFPPGMADEAMDLKTIFGDEIESFRLSLFESADFEEMVEKAEDFFSKIKMPDPQECELVMEVCREIERAKGLIKISELVEKLGHSR